MFKYKKRNDYDLELLEIYRSSLDYYLDQKALFGASNVPPAIIQGINEAKQGIKRVKKVLRKNNIPFEDLPGEDD